MNKRGQFYLIAAIILVTVIVGFAALRNYAQVEREYTRIYDLGEELKLETGFVYDHGVFQSKNLDELIESWGGNYSQYSKGQAIEDWVLVYGNETEMTALVYSQESGGQVSLITDSGKVTVTTISEDVKPEKHLKPKKSETEEGKEVIDVEFKNFTHSFELEEGENFFFVIRSGGYAAEG